MLWSRSLLIRNAAHLPCRSSAPRDNRKRAKKEVKLLSTLSERVEVEWQVGEVPNVIRYFSSWQEDDCFYIQLEYGFYGSLTKFTEHVCAGGCIDPRNRLRKRTCRSFCGRSAMLSGGSIDEDLPIWMWSLTTYWSASGGNPTRTKWTGFSNSRTLDWPPMLSMRPSAMETAGISHRTCYCLGLVVARWLPRLQRRRQTCLLWESLRFNW